MVSDNCEMVHDHHDQRQKSAKPRLLVVANRLPVSAKRTGDESWSLEMSPGGLVSGLVGMTSQVDCTWIGWPGVDVHDEIGKTSLTKCLAEKKCIPVFLEEVFDLFYNGYCNGILWPLFHHMEMPQEYQPEKKKSFQAQYDAYKKGNRLFLEVIKENYVQGDTIWIQDYHLMFLPKYLKEYNNKIKVGWFLHISFPSYEIFKTLPNRVELLQNVLKADLLGFHTYDFARYFMNTCTRILGVDASPQGIVDQGRLTTITVAPIGIDPERFIKACELPEVIQHMKEFEKKFAGKKVILGVDRLDLIKGIPQKYIGFERFLEENPNWRDKVVLVQIAIPSRIGVPQFQKLRNQTHELVGRINGRFGSVSSLPIHHLDCSVNFNLLCALYAISDVMLVTSVRDGMNLVSYEYIACQEKKKGVLILSEFAGAGQSLGAGCLQINPWNITEVSNAIGEALNMPAEERERRHRINFNHVITHSAQKWGQDFMSTLNGITDSDMRIRKNPVELPQEDVIQRYSQSNNRLILLGFFGTLTKPMEEDDLVLNPELKETLKTLCNDPKTTVVVLSRSSRSVLDKNFGGYNNIWLAAENGVSVKHTGGEWVTNTPENMNLEWVDGAKNVFNYFTERTPKSYIEASENSNSLVWNYQNADVEFGKAQAKDLLQHLWTTPISNQSVDVVRGDLSVEVHAFGETKGAAIGRILGEIAQSKSMTTPIDYVFCSGYFLEKDEDVYSFFEPEAPSDILVKSLSSKRKKTPLNVLDLKGHNYFSAAVGERKTNARYFLNSSQDVAQLLHKLAHTTTLTVTTQTQTHKQKLFNWI